MAILAFACTGCVEHVARVAPPEGGGATAVGRRICDPQTTAIIERDGLPREVPVSAWRREDDGGVARDESVLRTPTPWWQRFPCDLVTDALVPATFSVPAAATPQPRPAAAIDPALLAAHARAAGYGAPAPVP